MSEVRKIELPEKDNPLRADVSLLGSLVGEVLSDLHGPELLELVETVRKAAIRQREGDGDDEGEERLERMLAGLSHSEMMRVISAFSSYLRVVNIAERVESKGVMDMLASLGVHYAQGYYIAEPSSVKGFSRFENKGRAKLLLA